jgi:hypothetical protein
LVLAALRIMSIIPSGEKANHLYANQNILMINYPLQPGSDWKIKLLSLPAVPEE